MDKRERRPTRPVAVRSIITLSSGLALALVTACTASSSGGETSSSPSTSASPSTPVTSADCADRCTAKAESCGASAVDAQAMCSDPCKGSVTEAEVECLEGKACDAGATAASLAAACSGGAGSAPPGAAPPPPPPPPAGGNCGDATCGATQYCAMDLQSDGTWAPSGCRDVPSSCPTGGFDFCSCMTKLECPADTMYVDHCEQKNKMVYFGCRAA